MRTTIGEEASHFLEASYISPEELNYFFIPQGVRKSLFKKSNNHPGVSVAAIMEPSVV